MNLDLIKEDLLRIGGTSYEKNGFLCIICNIETANIEEILLRNILKLFGEYEIIETNDFAWSEEDAENGESDIEMLTNMPIEVYNKEFNSSIGKKLIDNENVTNAFDNLFSEISSSYNIRLATFLPNKEKTIYDEHLLEKFNEPFPVPFSGKIQSSFDDYDESGQFNISNEVDINQANNLNELLTFYADYCGDFYKKDGKHFRINCVKYFADGRIILFEREYENDFLDYSTSLIISLINNGYSVESISNDWINLENEFMNVIVYNRFEPELSVVKFSSLFHVDLTELEIKSEVSKFYLELKSLGYYPAQISIESYDFIYFFSNYFMLLDDLRDDTDFYLLGECLVKLYDLRKKIAYPLTEQDTVQHLFKEINNNEQNIYGSDFKLNDYISHHFKEFIAKSYYPSAIYNGKDFHYMVIECESKGIADIILWHYEKTETEIIIEYSLRELTQNLIMEFK